MPRQQSVVDVTPTCFGSLRAELEARLAGGRAERLIGECRCGRKTKRAHGDNMKRSVLVAVLAALALVMLGVGGASAATTARASDATLRLRRRLTAGRSPADRRGRA